MILPLFKCCSRFGTIKTGFWANQQSQFQKPVIIINGNNIFTDSLVYQYTSICCVKVKMWKPLSCVWLFGTPWTIQSKEFSRPEYWIAFPFSRGSSQPRDQTQVSCIGGRFFNLWVTREAHIFLPKKETGGKREVSPVLTLSYAFSFLNMKVAYDPLLTEEKTTARDSKCPCWKQWLSQP